MRLNAQSVGTAFVVFVSVAACESSSTIAGPRDFAELAAAEARWQHRSFDDYSYEIRTLCYCLPEVTRWSRVTVQAGVVVAVEAVEPDPNFPITSIRHWTPIDELFTRVRQNMARRGLGRIEADYDATLGYPIRIQYHADPAIADGDFTHWLRKVTPLP